MENVLVVNQFIVGFVVNNTGLYKKNENINFVITCMYFFFFLVAWAGMTHFIWRIMKKTPIHFVQD